MSKKVISLFLIFSVFITFCEPLFAESTAPEPYNTEEFPQSLKDLRRFEIITLGAMPFITLDVTLGYQFYNAYKEGFQAEQGMNIFQKQSYTPEEQKKIILTSLGISACVGLSDFTVRLIKRLSAKRKEKQQIETINITPISQDPDAVKLENPYQNDSEVIDVEEVEE